MNEVTKIISALLPKQIYQTSIKFRNEFNMLLTEGFQTAAGNTYLQGIRLSDRLIVVYDIGIGQLHPYLNKITIYAYRNKQIKKIVTRYYSCRINYEKNNRGLVKELLIKELLNEMKRGELKTSEPTLDYFVETLMEGIYKNQLETLKSIRSNMMLQD